MTEKNVGGRPREHDRDQIAKDMVEWAKLPDSINLCGFCCTREPPMNPRKISEWSKECNTFREAYETAKAFLGNRREKMLNEEMLHVKAYDLNATTYDQFLKDEKRQQMEFEASLKVNENKVDPKYVENFMEVVQQIKETQPKSSSKSASKSNNNDTKS